MARALTTLRTCIFYIISVIIFCSHYPANAEHPSIKSSKLVNGTCDKISNYCDYFVNIIGGGCLGRRTWRLTDKTALKNTECTDFLPSYEVIEAFTEYERTLLKISIPRDIDNVFFCLFVTGIPNSKFGGLWLHQGPRVGIFTENTAGRLFPDNILHQTNEIPTPSEYKTQVHFDRQRSLHSDANIETTIKPYDLTHDEDVNYINRVPRDHRAEIVEYRKYNKRSVENTHTIANSNKKNLVKQLDETNGSNNKEEIKIANNSLVIDSQNVDHIEIDAKNVHKNDNLREFNGDNNIKPDRNRRGFEFDSSFGQEDAKLMGLRVEQANKMETGESVPSLMANTEATLRLFGEGFTEQTVLVFTNEVLGFGEKCTFPIPGQFQVTPDPMIPDTAIVTIIAPAPKDSSLLYVCLKRDANSGFVHQGIESWKSLKSHNRIIPLWATILLISICLMFSALFSGLNLGLMSLDRTELKIIANTGSEQERRYAKAIAPVRDHGNFLLCSILLGNVAVNSTFTILLDDLTSGLFAVIFSTLAIVIMGEIIPQAICSRHGLAIGANTIVMMKVVMGITSPLAYPVSRLLDCVLGEEIGNVYNRERLKELVKVTNDVNDLDKDEVNIISGALELRKKTVLEVMTKIEDVFMLSIDSVLDFETMSEIVKSGFSRIPVYEGRRNNIVTVLFIKDLAFVDPDDNTPLRTLCLFYQNPCNFVFEDVTLDVMFKQFKEGNKGHMAFVHRVNNEGEGDPFYEVVGLVTLEDVIEELIQSEIIDETDVFTDNRSKRRRKTNKLKDFAAFAEKREHQRFRISPQLTLAAYQYLSTLEAFRSDIVSERVLRRLLRQDIINQIRVKAKEKSDPTTLIYMQGKASDYFVLILEGRVEVTVGREGLIFEAGPFTYFGVQALTQNVGGIESPSTAPSSAMGSLQNINLESAMRYSFIPDYSVRAVVDTIYITIKRSLYLAAKRATLMEKTSSLSRGSTGTGEMFDKEVDKLLASLDEDISVSGGDNRTPSRQISPNLQHVASPPQRSSISSAVIASPNKNLPINSDSPDNRENGCGDSNNTDNPAITNTNCDTADDSEPDEQSKLIQWIS